MRYCHLLTWLLLLGCRGEAVEKHEQKPDLNLLSRYHWFRYANREYALSNSVVFKYTDTLSYVFRPDSSFRKRSQALEFGFGPGASSYRLVTIESSGRYGLRPDGALTMVTAVPDRWRPEKVDTVRATWLIAELRAGRLTLVTPRIPGTFSREEDTLQFVGIQK
jgi:hypothetical protein